MLARCCSRSLRIDLPRCLARAQHSDARGLGQLRPNRTGKSFYLDGRPHETARSSDRYSPAKNGPRFNRLGRGGAGRSYQQEPGKRGHVPFDGPVGSRTLYKGPTLTRPERSAFARLQKLASISPMPSDVGPGPGTPATPISGLPGVQQRSRIDEILDAVEVEDRQKQRLEAKRSSDHVVNHHQGLNEKSPPEAPGSAHLTQPTQSAQGYQGGHIINYRRATQLIDHAEDDMQLWKTVRHVVLRPVETLGLDNDESTTKLGMPVMTTAGRDLSRLLAQAATVLRQRFPTSALQLAIIPELRKRGSSVFAMGASTVLYNEALEHLTQQSEDLPGTLELLQDLEREVIEPDQRTVQIVEAFREKLKAVRSGDFGEATRTIWQAEQNRDVAKDIHKIGRRLQKAVNDREYMVQYEEQVAAQRRAQARAA